MLLALSALALLAAAAPCPAASPAAASPDTEPTSPWQAVGPAGAGAAIALEIDVTEPEEVVLATTDGVFTSRDGGATWRMSSLPGVVALARHPAAGHRLYAVTQTSVTRVRLWRSDDRARTWTPLAQVDAPATGPRPSVTVHALALDAHRPDVLFVGGEVRAGPTGERRGRLWRSTDAGDSLAAVTTPGGLPPRALLITRSGVLLAGTERGILRSSDRGAAWRPADGGDGDVDHLAASAGEPQTLIAGTAAGRLLRSDDDGATWTDVDADLPRAAVTGLAVDPRDRRSLWAIFEGHGIHATRGGPWSAVEPPLPEGVVPRHLALAAGSPTRLYVATAAGEVYRRVPPSPACSDDADTLCLGGRFRVDVAWWGGRGDAGGTARAVPLGGGAGWFWLADPRVPAVAVRLRADDDGGPSRVHVASLTDVGLDLRIFDVAGGGFTTLRQAPGEQGAATGSVTFPPAGRTAGTPLWFTALPDGGCGGEAIDLCLWGGRFRVQVDWRSSDGEVGAAVADRLSSRAGWFRFSQPDEPELFVDLADGRDDNGHWWLSYASLGDAGFDLTVVDEESGESVTYSVPPGEPTSHRDTRALAGEAERP